MQTPIQLDKMRMLRFGMKNFSMLEKMLNNKNLNRIDLGNLTIEETVKAIWAGLEDKNGITVDQILDIVDDPKVYRTACESLGEAIAAASAAGEDEKNEAGAAENQGNSI